jgi:hypothetical protein
MKSIRTYETIADYYSNGKREICSIDHRMYEQQQQIAAEMKEEQN